MNLNVDHNQDMPIVHIQKPAPFVPEKNGALQIKLVLVSIVLVAVAWIGVLIFLGVQIIGRVYG